MTKVKLNLQELNSKKIELEKIVRDKQYEVVKYNSIPQDDTRPIDIESTIGVISIIGDHIASMNELIQKENLEKHDNGKSNTWYIRHRSNLESLINMYSKLRTYKKRKNLWFNVIILTKEKKKRLNELYQQVTEVNKKINTFNSSHFVEFEYNPDIQEIKTTFN